MNRIDFNRQINLLKELNDLLEMFGQKITALEKRISTLEKLATNKKTGEEIFTEIHEILSNKNYLELVEILESIKEQK